MRFLKKKIQLKQEYLTEKETLNSIKIKIEPSLAETADSEFTESPGVQEFILPIRKPRQKPTAPDGNSKNIVKNYGKALCAFACSNIAVPYVENIISKENDKNANVSVAGFVAFIKAKKESINSIESLRRMLITEGEEKEDVQMYKKVFQEVSIIFLKYFAVNWIFGGKLMHKNAHLKYRFKMLRRIQDPEHFTYLKTSAK